MNYLIFAVAAIILVAIIYYYFYDLTESKRLAKEYKEAMDELERLQDKIDIRRTVI